VLRVQRTRSWVRSSFRAMGSPCEFLVDGTADHVRLAIAEIGRLESIWSRFDRNSELVALNESGGQWFSVSVDLLDIVNRCATAYRMTSGAFDPTVIDSLERLGYDRTFSSVPANAGNIPQPIKAHGFTSVEIDVEQQRIRMPDGVRLDLGGIGKGLAADRVAAFTVAGGARSVCVSLGGDLHVAGEPSEAGGWPLPIQHPLHRDREFATTRLTTGGIVTSTTLERTWRRSGRPYHHIVDPGSGDSSRTDVAAAIVSHGSTATAEVLAKAAIVVGLAASEQLVVDNGAWGWFLLTDDQLVTIGHRLPT
jgi:FAD:protein FMN transferase